MTVPVRPAILTAVAVLQLVLSFIALILAAFSAVCFGAEFAYGVVWWSFGWTLVISCLRWWTHDLRRSTIEQLVHLAFEVFTLLDWVVATGVLVSLNIHLHHLRQTYAFDVKHDIPLTGELITHLFTSVGIGGLYCSYALNAVTGIIFIMLLFSTYGSIKLLRISREQTLSENLEKDGSYEKLSTQEQLVRKVPSY
ncbi:hypothetical protein, variant [Cladophialophora immunda]|uniref:MARVEL domain-containing protein n=1 Tax=Cladophialophora immunda TaxID=569365 RepID=A0A0D2C7S2_9EURO|nr:uncharacterized protein PV07_06962 [Cladophialophora immunda]XP_016247419.1 hypothetical protein, variant [Cladophialophora immunda]KIW27202.1 hypothetical protein PV07_06962 [Cladophialophora immunda]KIW27203.1 hypothetical protein, variant [Cladophialophora immunda]OQV02058.1 hypothetical protein CLAIMM_07313 [Cladophialophora immunda]